ncbi:hypothetical protein I5G71_gp52 [Mycobacterium phage Patt]|uniref:Uncharacterized protein n=1 Tax=Mycobacterium phage Patt TaxID=2530139 RepID=A0A481VR81_9CAUD|nr:hypothetical protein I5G71_gp52 [Mycobacterium phage Patt]AYQ98538.1 hypothetical protein SEA_REPTAR3000_53 [Mycobacterium phage Reptar3000]QBI96033.1 hypothetical protein SEA_MISSDAISY_53 [Mycobacterium phage MissDaisy]QBI96285.1 hypothetical protein SEA_PATT_52 [Mycobacterium phage Patt]
MEAKLTRLDEAHALVEPADPQHVMYEKHERAPGGFELAVLGGLQNLAHVYAGTVLPAEKQRRRARNRAARSSRKINRRK